MKRVDDLYQALLDMPEGNYQDMLIHYGIPQSVASGRLGERQSEVDSLMRYFTQRRLPGKDVQRLAA